MNSGLSGIEEGGKDKKQSTVGVRAKAQSGSTCSFCWFVLKLHPNPERMTSRDAALYTEHLKKSHGLKDEIQP